MTNFSKGKFIVLDGTDGSGKGTQTQILLNHLLQEGYRVKVADFPQYGSKSAGLVEDYLNGKFGSAAEVGPYRASIFYAVDRYDASFKIKAWLDEGYTVISNRYVTANMGHQGGKIPDQEKRKKYLDWLYDLEYRLFQIPKPDLNIILHVDAALAQTMVDCKGSRNYLGNEKRDIHEADIEHLLAAEKVYLEIVNCYPDFTLIECVKNGVIMSRESIHEMIWNKVTSIIDPSRNDNRTAISPKLRVQRLSPFAKLPARAYSGDVAYDLFSSEYISLLPGDRTNIHTGIKMAIPEGFAGLIWDKGGIANNGISTMGGVIDSGYRGEILVNLINHGEDDYNIIPGQKIAQIIIQKIETPEIQETIIDDETDRRDGAFGSSGLF